MATVTCAPRTPNAKAGPGKGMGTTASLFLTRYSWGNSAAQGSNSCHGNLLIGEFLGAGMPRCHHVWLEQGPLQVDVVVAQGLVYSSENLNIEKRQGTILVAPEENNPYLFLADASHCLPHLFCHILTTFEVVVTVRKDFRFHNRNNTILELRDSGDQELENQTKMEKTHEDFK